MNMNALHEAYPHSLEKRHALVKYLEHINVLHSEAVKEALLAIPREAFVPSFYRDTNSPLKDEKWQKVDATDPTYLAQIYQDQSLVTIVDTRGNPISSSSMPSVMMRMIEALQVNERHRVLEVGSGTGYNATILAFLAATCTTVDINTSCVEYLRTLIAQFHIKHLTAFTVNGIQGYPTDGPYDRILITASAPTIPLSWIEQLAPGGRLVCDFAGSMEHAFLVLCKDEAGHITGSIRPEKLWFMPLYGESIPDLVLGRFPLVPAVLEIHDARVNCVMQHLPNNRSFRWFLQTAIPGIKLQQVRYPQKKLFRLIAPANNQYIEFAQDNSQGSDDSNWNASWHADVQTDHVFLHSVFSAYDQWKDVGHPPVEHYGVSLNAETPIFTLGELYFPMLSL